MGQLRSLEKRLQKDDTLRQRYQGTIDTNVKAGYVRKIDQTELNETRDELQWCLPHHPVINPHKPEKVRRVCNAAAQYQGVALNDKRFSGPDLLQSLVGLILRFREHQIALSADLEAMFLQIGVPSADSRCLRFLWRDNPEQRIEVYDYSRHVFGAKSSPTCAIYALHQVAKDNANNDENLVRTVQRNFYMDDFLKSVRKPQEATQIYQKVRDVLSKGGLKLTKWITSDEEVKSQIPETDRSTKVVKTFEAKPQSSSILGLNLNVDTDNVSEEAMCIVAYLPDETTLKVTYVIGKCRVAPIRHKTIPNLELQAAVYGVRQKRQILREHDVKIDKVYHWTDSSTVLQWLQSAHKKQQVFVANRAAEILESSSMDQWRHVKGIENPVDIVTGRMSIEGLKESVWLNRPAWLHTDEEKWPKPWCQANKVEAEQATSTVAAETKLHQKFDWDRYSSFNRIRNFIAYCMRFKAKQKGPLKADEIHGAEQIRLRFVQAENFPNVSKSITNSKEISKTLNIAKLSPFIEEDGKI
ncbi:uncharacterized protein LOC142341284 [Convolutriloba macropyga]|uniref:uncharacterized protein LOC142341284 n=1 Tax=Convolutriloba macropyga TaxID=536237 RepID=UPI003F52279B